MAKNSGGKGSAHPGFNKMVHTGGHHPGFKAGVDKAKQAPMPQPAPGNMPMQGTVTGPAPMGPGGMPQGNEG